MSYIENLASYVYKMYLSAASSSEEDSSTNVAEKIAEGYSIEELSKLVKYLNNLSESMEWEFRKRLIGTGHSLDYIRGKKISSYLGRRWYISPGEHRFSLNIIPDSESSSRVTYWCLNQHAPMSPHGGIWLFKAENGSIIAVAEGMDSVKNG